MYYKLLFLLFFSQVCCAQVFKADYHPSDKTILNSLIDTNSISVSNLKTNCDPGARGTFSNTGNILPFSQGMVLSTGSVKYIGTSAKLNYGFFTNAVDSDLFSFANNNVLQDLCSFEFDIQPKFDSLSISYVFASEEYFNYAPPKLNTYNDCFGFFISGSGIQGKINLATLPNGDRVSIENINPVKNQNYLVYNNSGDEIGFNALTRQIDSGLKLLANGQYHIKIVISDVRDPLLDSGIFLKAKGFKSLSSQSEAVLSVNFLKVQALVKNKAAEITWKVNAEKNTCCYQVYKSINGKDFVAIAKVAAKQSIQTNSYFFTDLDVSASGNFYYKIKEISLDAKEQWSNVVTVLNPLKSERMFSIYSNQSLNHIFLHVDSQEALNGLLEIFDLSGKMMLRQSLTLLAGISDVNIDLDQLADGIYCAQLRTEKGDYVSKKFLCQHLQ